MGILDASPSAPNIEVKSAGSLLGDGVFTTKTLSPGDIVITVRRPLLVALSIEKLSDTCYECYRQEGEVPVEVQLGFPPCPAIWGNKNISEVKLSRCAGCKTVKYCGKACQKASWASHHALECPIFKQLHPREVPNHIRAVLSILLLKQVGRVKEDDWNALLTCLSHIKEYDKGDKVQELSELKQMARFVTQISPFRVEEDLVLGILMRLKINSLTLETPFNDPLGLALHPLIAKVNHSCEPNSYIRFPALHSLAKSEGRDSVGLIVLTPLRTIETGDQITISYVDETLPVGSRQQELRERYFFTCNCIKCARDIDADRGATSTVLEAQKRAKAVLHALPEDNPLTPPESHIAVIKTQFAALFHSDSNWNFARYPFPQMLHQLTLLHVDLQDFVQAFRLAALLHFRVDPQVYSSPVHPLRLTHTMLIIKLTGAVLDAISPAATITNPAAQRLSREVDLTHWYDYLVHELVFHANGTWKELPWPWLRKVVKQREDSSPATTNVGKEKRRMEMLCTQTLASLKQI